MAAGSRLATAGSVGTYGALAALVSTAWTVANAVTELGPIFAVGLGLVGSVILTAASDPLERKYKGWRRPVLSVGLIVLNAAVLASAMLGVEETASA